MASSRLFFCYSRNDAKQFAVELATKLKAIGQDVWIDQMDIKPGKTWDTEIEVALDRCTTLLLIISTKAMESRNVRDEISFALEEGKEIIPIVISDVSIPYRIRRFQRIDFRENYDHAFNHLTEALRLEKNNPVPEETPLATDDKKKQFELLKKKQAELLKPPQGDFYTPVAINDLVARRAIIGEMVRGHLLIYETLRQHTWLVATNRQLYCLLDDEKTRKENDLFVWQMLLSQARKKVVTKVYNDYSGLLDIGDRKDWLYSTKLFPEPTMLVQAIKRMIYDNKFAP